MVQEVKSIYADLQTISTQFGTLSDQANAVLNEISTKRGNLEGEWVGFGYNSFSGEMDGDIIPSLLKLKDALISAQTQVTTISNQLLNEEVNNSQPINLINAEPANIA